MPVLSTNWGTSSVPGTYLWFCSNTAPVSFNSHDQIVIIRCSLLVFSEGSKEF